MTSSPPTLLDTAFAVLQPVDSGKVDLDAPITDYLSGFSIRGADASAITIRMLLSHTSGLPNPTLVPTTGSSEGSVALVAGFEVASKPGSTYAYSNFNYHTLARMVEVVGDQDFAGYLDENIFAPLGMGDTTMVITAEDMAKWLGMQQRAGTTVDGTRIFSTDLIEESHTPQPKADDYNLGWQLTSRVDPERIGHSGSLLSYAARQDLAPSSGCATVVLLDSFTTIHEHQFDIGIGPIDISEGKEPDLGFPLATVVDLCLGAFTVLVLALGLRGLRRSGRWARKRAEHPWWRRSLRLLPQAIMPIVALGIFVGLTLGQGNPATPLNVFGLWPGFMVLIAVGGVIGVVLIVARLRAYRTQPRQSNEALGDGQ